MANRYEIIYKHFDMHPDYTGYTIKWANDKKGAIKCFCTRTPNKDGVTKTKGGATVRIVEVNEIPAP